MKVDNGTPCGIMVVLNEGSNMEDLTMEMSKQEKIELHALRNNYFHVWNQTVLEPYDLVPENTNHVNPVFYLIKEGMFKIIIILFSLYIIYCIVCRYERAATLSNSS